MSKRFTYETILIYGSNKGVYAEISFDSEKSLGLAGSVRVKAEFEGAVSHEKLIAQIIFGTIIVLRLASFKLIIKQHSF